jgi:hypothetical protein
MIEILKYILAGFGGSIVTYFIVNWWRILGFKSLIKLYSTANKPVIVDGENYFFMTQDQIQKALESLYKFESHGLPDNMEVNG